MKLKSTTQAPVWICTGVIAVVCAIQWLGYAWPRFDLFARLEWMTYDWRVRLATRSTSPAATNLGFVAIGDDSIDAVQDGLYGELPYRFGLYWPRQVYARLIDELSAQGATAVGFDVLFADLRPDHASMRLPDGREESSDEFFARELRAAGNVVLAADKGTLPHDLFRTNALAMASISAYRDQDGILRRAKAYEDVYLWHPLIKDASRLQGWDLRHARVEPTAIVLPLAGGGETTIPLAEDGQFNQAALFRQLTSSEPPPAVSAWSRPFTAFRCWQMGIVLAAQALKLDLDNARIDPEQGRIVLAGPDGLTRTIPVDAECRFYIDWSMTPYDPRLRTETIESLLLQYEYRRSGRMAEVTNRWRDRLVVVGSTATGNDLTDLGATPLEKETYLLCQQWNVANSVLTERFVRTTSVLVKMALIVLLGTLAGLLTWNLRVLPGTIGVLACAALYAVAAAWVFMQWRWWLPIVLPVGGALFVLHASLVTYRAIHEQRERRRVNAIFGRVVSPNVRDELLAAPQLDIGGARREITVMFADIRGFTRMTDASQSRAEEHVRRLGLAGSAARQYHERQAREVLDTVNLYLSLIADTVKRKDGTLDKYIGDCVMAFWGAPTSSDRPAAACVQAAIESMQAMRKLNQNRAAENERIEAENNHRTEGEEPLPPLPFLSVGIGINTGLATAGLIGSEAHIFNYTVFGREVNVASRLEEIASAGQIVISEATHLALQREDASLADLCVELPQVTVKGIQVPLRNYEVVWREDGHARVARPETQRVSS